MAISLSGSAITQSGTDSLPTATGNGLTITAENGVNTVDAGSNTLQVNGTLTIDASKERLKAGKQITVGAGGTLRVVGNKSVNSLSIPTFREGLVVTGTDAAAVQCQGATSGSPSVVYIENAAISLHGTGMTIIGSVTDNVTNLNASIQTRGEWAYIKKGGTGDRRIRCINGAGQGYFDFQAKVTYCELWMNYNNPPTNLIGFTPVGCDGIEIQPKSSGATTLVNLLNYDDRYIVASYYTNSKLVVYGGAWVRLKNGRIGTNMPFTITSVPSGKKSVLEFSKIFDFKIVDALGVNVSGAKVMIKPTGTAPTGIQASGQTTDIAYNTNLVTATSGADGQGSIEFMYCVAQGNPADAQTASAATLLGSKTYSYFCDTTTRGAEQHTVTIRKYGYKPVSVTLNLIGSGNGAINQALEALPVISTETIASALIGIAFSVANGAVNVSITSVRTTQEIYDYWVYWISQDAQYNIDTSLITISNKTLNITGSITTSATISGAGNATSGIIATGTASVTGSGSYGTLAVSDSNSNSQVTIVGITLDANTKLYVSTDAGTTFTQLASTTYKYNSGSGSVIFKLTKGTLTQTDSYALASGLTNTFTSFTNDVGVLLQATETNLKAVIPTASVIKTAIEQTDILAKKADIPTGLATDTELKKLTGMVDVDTTDNAKNKLKSTALSNAPAITGFATSAELDKVVKMVAVDATDATKNKFTSTALSNAPTGSGGSAGLSTEQTKQLLELYRSQVAVSYITATAIVDGATEIPIANTYTDGYFKGHYIVINDGAGNVVQRYIAEHINRTVAPIPPNTTPTTRTVLVLNEAIGAVPSAATIMILIRTTNQDKGLTTTQETNLLGIKSKTDLIQFTADNLIKAIVDKTGYTLTDIDKKAIATEVEKAMLNEADGEAILQAIKDKIGSENVSATAIVDAIKSSSIGKDINLIKTLKLIE
jgi:hypothetical protein